RKPLSVSMRFGHRDRSLFEARQRIQFFRESFGRCVPGYGIFRQATRYDAVKVRRHGWIRMRRRQRRGRENAAANGLEGIRVERTLARHHFIENDAERKKVGT